jgi:hypothetical protein
MPIGGDEIATALYDALSSHTEEDRRGEQPANVVDALFAISRSLDAVARSINRLGNADAATPMGGLEALGAVLKDGMSEIASALGNRS